MDLDLDPNLDPDLDLDLNLDPDSDFDQDPVLFLVCIIKYCFLFYIFIIRFQICAGGRLIHVGCYAHKLNKVGEQWQLTLHELNSFVTSVKAIFFTSRNMRTKYQKFLTVLSPDVSIPLFPLPNMTRWNSWFRSVQYIATHFAVLRAFLKMQKLKKASAAACLRIVESEEQALFVHSQALFAEEMSRGIVELTETLQTRNKPLAIRMWGQLESIKDTLEALHGGLLSPAVEMMVNMCNGDEQVRLTNSFQICASLSLEKLNKYMGSPKNEKTNSLFRSLYTLFDPTNAGTLKKEDELVRLASAVPQFASFCFIKVAFQT